MQMKREKHEKEIGRIINDAIIYLAILAGFSLIIYCVTKNADASELPDRILQIVGDSCIYLLGLVGIFEFCYDNNLNFFVPSRYRRHKDEDLRNKAREAFMDYFDSEKEFIEKTVDARTEHILSILGLTSDDLKTLQAAALRAQVAPLTDIASCRNKMRNILFNSNVIFDLSQTGDYHPDEDVKYYLRTHDLLYKRTTRDDIVKVMATFIKQTLHDKEFDLIMVPHSSNLYLGDGVSHIMHKPMIKMIPPGTADYLPFRFENDIPKPRDGKSIRVIVIHDVLFSGKQIIDSINTLMETKERLVIEGVFCLVRRTVKERNIQEIKDNCKCEVYPLLELSEDDIRKELEAKGRA